MWQQRGDVVDGGLFAVHHTESVGHESACGSDQFGELAGKRQPLGIVLARLAGVETDVLQQQDVPVGQTLGTGARIAAGDVVGQLHVLAQMLTECGGDRRQRQFQVGFTLGPSQMRGHDDLGTRVGQRLERGH